MNVHPAGGVLHTAASSSVVVLLFSSACPPPTVKRGLLQILFPGFFSFSALFQNMKRVGVIILADQKKRNYQFYICDHVCNGWHSLIGHSSVLRFSRLDVQPFVRSIKGCFSVTSNDFFFK